jgi:multicomponent Na+:H+ antiporter subunit E
VTRVAVPARSERGRLVRAGATAGVAFAFYLALGDPTDPFDLVTGLVSAAVVAAVLGRVTFERTPSRATLGVAARAAVFLPALLWAVVRANLSLAAVVLDPRLPIDPVVVRIPAPEGTVSRALLANAITLTPGTLTLDVTDDELVVHALTAASRAELLEGSLARWVAFVTGGAATVGPGTGTGTGSGTGSDGGTT